MNEGWGNGHKYGIEYREIWNEPDMYGKCLLGTPEEFAEFFSVAAKHLKQRFPKLKIGRPAFAGPVESRIRPFLAKPRDDNVVIDFFSWHGYESNVSIITKATVLVRNLLDEYGFTETESILNE